MLQNKINTRLDERNQNRLTLIFILFLFLFSIVLVRLFYIQIIHSDKYRRLAEVQHIKKMEVKAKRGEIYDRNGILLASSVLSRSFAIDPFLVQKDSLSRFYYYSFGQLLGITPDKLKSILNTSKRFVWLKRGLLMYSPALDTFSFAGHIPLDEPKRVYLYGNSASNFIGFTNIDNIGASGLEYTLDSILRGKDGFVYYSKDARGGLHPNFEIPSQPAQNGEDIKLTIDINLQRLANFYLEEGVKETRSNGGCIIAMNPENGEILALANYPNFDPNDLAEIDIPNLALYATNFAFEPGSTIKPLIAAIAYDRGFVNENSLFNGHNGKFVYGDVVITDEHPFQNKLGLADALIYSSNIAFAQIATLVPPEILENGLLRLGFGKKTGIGLPGELKGYVKKGDTLNYTQQMFLGYGYGLFLTPLQLIVAYSTLANNGLIVKPKILFNDQFKLTYDTLFKRETVERIKRILVKVVDQGTATSTKIQGIEIAGKTGTSQKFEDGNYSKTNYINTFVGFLPAKKPKMLILILLDQPKTSIYASYTVVPIFRKLVLSILNSKLAKYIY